jgi:hypothetical protein
MEILRKQGRYGDTELAHVNPREKALLKALGGAGSRNPSTGMKEYFPVARAGNAGMDRMQGVDYLSFLRDEGLLRDEMLRNLASGEPAGEPVIDEDERMNRALYERERRIQNDARRNRILQNMLPGEPSPFEGPRDNRPYTERAMDFLANQGRYGDTEIAPLTPREMEILKSLGGSGTINPRTGLREYFNGSADLGSPTGDTGGAMGDSTGRSESGSPAGDTGGFMGDMTSGYSAPESDPSALGGYTGMGFAPTGSGSLGAGTGNISGSMLGDYLSSPAAVVGAIGGTPLGALAFGMERANQAARAAGYSVQDPISERSAFEAGFPGNFGSGLGEMRNEAFVPVANPTPRYLRGGEMAPPQEISSFIGPGMSDIQQRALISTYGTQGVNSAFRTDPVRRYYANLLSRGLISDAGAPVQNPYVLPIEQQYASSVLGRPFANPADAAATYESIRGFL